MDMDRVQHAALVSYECWCAYSKTNEGEMENLARHYATVYGVDWTTVHHKAWAMVPEWRKAA
jgi:Mn-dependent DtxR family transcriptional regulator